MTSQAKKVETEATIAETRAKVRKAIEHVAFYAADLEDEDTGVFPIKEIAKQHGIEWPPPSSHPPPPNVDSSPRLLVVDDDPDVLSALEVILTDEGYTVWRARDGVEGIEQLHNMPSVDCILVDVSMPRLDGLDFKRIVQKMPAFRDVPIIIISGRRLSDAQQTGVMMKPLDLEGLLTTIRSRIQESRETKP